MVDVSIPIRSNKISGSILIYTDPSVLESKSPTMLLAVLETLFKITPPAISNGKGNESRELGQEKIRDRDNKLECDADVCKVAAFRDFWEEPP